MRALAFLAIFVSAALPAAALPVCDEDGFTPAQAEVEPEPEVEESSIVPCALVESGALGNWCVDATGYLITQSGVVLCEVRLPPEDLTAPEAKEKVAASSAPDHLEAPSSGLDGAPGTAAWSPPSGPFSLVRSPGASRLLGPRARSTRPAVPPA